MRRLTLGLLAVLAICTGVAIVSLLEPCHLVPGTARLAMFAIRQAGHLGARAAWAADEMQFTRVSPESAALLERRMHPRRGSVVISRVTSDTLVPMEPPTVPVPALPPGRSGEMMRIGSDIHIEKDQTVVGDVVAISGDVTVDGHVKGDVTALRGDVYLGSTARVDGDVACIGGELHEESGAIVGGQRVTGFGGRRTRGPRIFRHNPDVDETVSRSVHNMTRFGATLATLLLILGLIWLVLRIAGGRTAAAVEVLRRETAASLGVGLLAWVLIIPSLIALCLVVAILCITIIGIPVALAALFAYGVVLAVLVIWGYVVGVAWFGEQLGRRFWPGGGSLTRMAMYGAIAILGTRAAGYLLHIVPGFGFLGGFLVVITWITSGLMTTLGAGSLLRSEFATGLPGRWWRGSRTPRGAGFAQATPAAPFAPPTSEAPVQPWPGATAPGAPPTTDPGAPGSGPSSWPPS